MNYKPRKPSLKAGIADADGKLVYRCPCKSRNALRAMIHKAGSFSHLEIIDGGIEI